MNKNAILITGLSGAGKTSVASILEDMGYLCVDNYPLQLIDNLIELIESSDDSRYDNIALTIPLKDYACFYHKFKNAEIPLKVVVVEADGDIVLRRYKSTRRSHPLIVAGEANSLDEAIELEKSYITSIKDSSVFVLDTTHLTLSDLKKRIEELYATKNEVAFGVSFVSFGFKNGVPLDADLMLDVRFLPNPFWEPEIKHLSGNDIEVYNYVMKSAEGIEFVEKLDGFLDYLFEKYIKEGKNHLTVAIGCTGGQHRSVSIVNYLYDHYSKQFKCYKDHRDRQDYYHG